MPDWQPLKPPISWPRCALVSFRQSRQQLRSSFGPPQEVDADSNGIGLMDVWALGFSCGLELILLAFKMDSRCADVTEDQLGWIELQSNSADLQHIAAHLPFELVEVGPYDPNRVETPPARWALLRQDDNGHVFEVQRFASRCAASSALANFEALHHKQSYWLTEVEVVGAARAKNAKS